MSGKKERFYLKNPNCCDTKNLLSSANSEQYGMECFYRSRYFIELLREYMFGYIFT